MTYPMLNDPIPPGHGEPLRQPEADRTYVVVVTLGDGVSNHESAWGKLDKALAERDRVRKELRESGYTRFHVGVIDDDDPERGYIDYLDEEDS